VVICLSIPIIFSMPLELLIIPRHQMALFRTSKSGSGRLERKISSPSDLQLGKGCGGLALELGFSWRYISLRPPSEDLPLMRFDLSKNPENISRCLYRGFRFDSVLSRDKWRRRVQSESTPHRHSSSPIDPHSFSEGSGGRIAPTSRDTKMGTIAIRVSFFAR